MSKSMTRAEVIETVRAAFDAWESEYDTGDDWSEKHKARDMAIKALEKEPCEDAVDRKEVIELAEFVQSIKDKYHDNKEVLNYGTLCDIVIKAWKIVNLPPVIPTHITCKNCNHYEDMLVALDKEGNKKILHFCRKYRKSVSEDWYCPDGERRE